MLLCNWGFNESESGRGMMKSEGRGIAGYSTPNVLETLGVFSFV